MIKPQSTFWRLELQGNQERLARYVDQSVVLTSPEAPVDTAGGVTSRTVNWGTFHRDVQTFEPATLGANDRRQRIRVPTANDALRTLLFLENEHNVRPSMADGVEVATDTNFSARGHRRFEHR